MANLLRRLRLPCAISACLLAFIAAFANTSSGTRLSSWPLVALTILITLGVVFGELFEMRAFRKRQGDPSRVARHH